MKQIETSEYKHVYILGTKWTIIIVNDKNSKEYNDAQLSQVDGRCMKYMNIIYVKGPSLMCEMIEGAGEARYKHVLRHEILHAFMASSGLRCCTLKTSSWSNNEEMIDFFAEQLPKISDVYKELGILPNNELGMGDCIKYAYVVMVGESIECVCDTEEYANNMVNAFNKYFDFNMYYVKRLPVLKGNEDLEGNLSHYDNPVNIKYLKNVVDGVK